VSQWIRECEERLRNLALAVGALRSAAAADVRALTQASDEVAGQVRRLRMRPFFEACASLPRVARDVAAAGGKEVRLTVAGGDVEVDRAVLDGLREALVQLVRNAVDHGIESRSARAAAGKAATGTVTVAAALSGDRVVVTISDDGAGLDLAAIRRQLAERGRPVPDDDADVAGSLFESGISTRVEATPISGRGVGLDIVRTAVVRIRGSVGVAWEPGRGTTFTIECPPTLASVRVILVSVDSQVLAVPTTNVERLIRVGPDQVRRAEGRDVAPTGDGPVPLVALASLLPPLAPSRAPGPIVAVVVTAGGQRVAVAVDELLAEQEVMLRPLGRDDGLAEAVTGAATLGGGRVALILDPAAIVAAGLGASAAGLAATGEAAAPPRPPRVLVVDDSITTRTLEQSILEAAGYEVRTAVDGDDAWRQLQEHGADAVVADIEMPRMDGFALTEAIRGSKRFKDLPVVLVTALETPEHRARGLAVGADAYLGKSGFDQHALIEVLRQLAGGERPPRAP
jgi:two-component system chemotaxis sensor kinase CheA